MVVETWAIERVIPYHRNARKISERAVAKVARSLKEFGWQQPLVVTAKGELIVGHCRLLAAKKLGWSEVPVVVAAHLSASQVRAYRLMDNRSHDETEWDFEALGIEVADLKISLPDLELTGFELHEIEKLLKSPAEADERANAVPALPDKAVSLAGDLWVCGTHRVLCGDATKAEDVARLLGDVKPLLMVTDPPYGVEYDPTWRDGKGGFSTALVKQRGKVANDDRCDWKAAYELYPGDVVYIWHASLKTIEFGVSIRDAGSIVRACIIWRKQQALFGQGHYHWQHEPCWYAVRDGGKANWLGDRKQTTVWDVQNLNPTGNRTEERVGHGTQKPIELMRRPILNHTKRGEAIYDPFLGSGTTMIAAEDTGRVCYGLEIDPKYVDVIVQRWQQLTGKSAGLAECGRTFEQVAADRAKAA